MDQANTHLTTEAGVETYRRDHCCSQTNTTAPTYTRIAPNLGAHSFSNPDKPPLSSVSGNHAEHKYHAWYVSTKLCLFYVLFSSSPSPLSLLVLGVSLGLLLPVLHQGPGVQVHLVPHL